MDGSGVLPEPSIFHERHKNNAFEGKEPYAALMYNSIIYLCPSISDATTVGSASVLVSPS